MSWATRCKEGNGHYNLFNFTVLLYIIPEQFTRVSIMMGVATCNGSWWIFSLVGGSTKEMENTIKICRLSADAVQRTCRSQVHRFTGSVSGSVRIRCYVSVKRKWKCRVWVKGSFRSVDGDHLLLSHYTKSTRLHSPVIKTHHCSCCRLAQC